MELIYLVRHGQSRGNLERLMGGDSGLTPKGLAQAAHVASILYERDADRIYHSPYLRTTQTAKVIQILKPELNLRPVKRLREINFGDFDLITYDQFKKDYRDSYKARKKDKFNFQFPNGENYEMLEKRAQNFVDHLSNKSGTSIVVSHQATIRAMIAYLLGEELKDHINSKVEQGVVYTINPDSKEIRTIR